MSFLLVEPIIPLPGEDIIVGGYRSTGERPLGRGSAWETRTVTPRRQSGSTETVNLLYQTIRNVQLTTMHYTSAEGHSCADRRCKSRRCRYYRQHFKSCTTCAPAVV